MPNSKEMMWLHCNECSHETEHSILNEISKERNYDEEGYPVEVVTSWTIVQCNGCKEVGMQRSYWCSKSPTSTTWFFPPRISRRKPDWVNRYEVPKDYIELLNEVYIALHADSRMLASMGTRALIDLVIRRNVGEQDNFSAGLDALIKKEIISTIERKTLKAAIEVGHASAHRGHKPKSEDVNTVIDIIENLIRREILNDEVQELKTRTPEKKKKEKKNV